jgi:hypothetical protein
MNSCDLISQRDIDTYVSNDKYSKTQPNAAGKFCQIDKFYRARSLENLTEKMSGEIIDLSP